MNTFSAKSTFFGLISRGMFWNVIVPWRIKIDLDRKRINITKRNWYLISVDEDTFNFSSVRHVKIDKFLFGADLHIKMYSGTAKIYAIGKRDAEKIRDLLLDGIK